MTTPLHMPHALDELCQIVAERAHNAEHVSYTAQLLQSGAPKIARKLGEEAVELVIELVSRAEDQQDHGQKRARIIAESADLLYHLCVAWQDQGIAPAEIWAELKNRQGQSGLQEKANRQKPS